MQENLASLVMTLYKPFNLSKPSSRSVTGIKLELSQKEVMLNIM